MIKRLNSIGSELNESQIATAKGLCVNFIRLHESILELTERELLGCMFVERCGKSRYNILNRLYSRYIKLRDERERKELLA